MGERAAFTSGGMSVVSGDGLQRMVPAGPCSIGMPRTVGGCPSVSWRAGGVNHRAEVTAEDLAAYLRGCVVQYAR